MDRKALLGGGGLPPRHPMMRPPPGRGNNSNTNNRRCVGGPKDYTPIPWDQHFAESRDVKGKFRGRRLSGYRN